MIRSLWVMLVAGTLPCLVAGAKIEERHVITVDADQVVGSMYNLWDVRMMLPFRGSGVRFLKLTPNP